MIEQGFTFKDITNIFRTNLSRSGLVKLEKSGKIPEASRVQRGNSPYRYWNVSDLPLIGSQLSKLPSTGTTEIVTVYISKGGGSFKSTFVWNFSRWLGLHGKKILVVPLDQQLNQSFLNNVDNSFETVSETRSFLPGISDILMKGVPIKKTIIPTTLPNIHIIPESPILIELELWLSSQNFREQLIAKAIEPIKKEYDVIIFDTAPSWGNLVSNAVIASSHLISPIGVDLMSYKTLPVFLQMIKKFCSAAKHNFDNIFLVPGFVDNSRLCQQVLGAYQQNYPDIFTVSNIRRSTSVPEALNAGLSIFEFAGKAPVADDYWNVCDELWSKIAKTERLQVTQ